MEGRKENRGSISEEDMFTNKLQSEGFYPNAPKNPFGHPSEK